MANKNCDIVCWIYDKLLCGFKEEDYKQADIDLKGNR